MSRLDRELFIACFVLALAVYVFFASVQMQGRGEFIESPGLFPGLISVVLCIFGIVYAVRSLLQGGRLRFGGVGQSLSALISSRENRTLMLGILYPGLYVSLAIPFIGFYYSSALFMAIIFFFYVKRWKRWTAPFISAGLTLLLYLTFNKLFMLQIR
jgi:hypothetical protein